MRSLLLDTNLLLLLIVGSFDRQMIQTHKRTRGFTAEDFDQLVGIIGGYQQVWITSHCLGEVSNLLRQTERRLSADLMRHCARVLGLFQESHIPMGTLFGSECLPRLGVADTGLAQKAKGVTCTLTADLDLYLQILHDRHTVYNFNHLRQERLLQ